MNIKLSIILPCYNEEKSLPILFKEIEAVMNSLGIKYEIIAIDDGSKDNTFAVLSKLKRKFKQLKIIKHRGNWGKSTALQNGFDKAVGEIIITMDSDLQDNPKEIPRFLKKLEEGYDLVSGWKKNRHDPIHFVIMSRILNNFLIPTLTGLTIHDTNCGFKAYRKEVAKSLNLYGELYRYIPVIVSKDNYKVGEISVDHRPRKYGISKYGFSKNIKGLVDLFTIIFLTGYVKRPGHFFGGFGILLFGVGFLIGIYITYLRITTGSIQFRQPLLFLGVLLIVVGIQLTTTGLLAELLVYLRQTSKDNSVDKKLD